MKSATYTIARADTGAVLPYARVTVALADGVTPAAIFDQTGAPLGNPLTADAAGAVTFAAADAQYVLLAVSADGLYSVPPIEVDVYDLPALVPAAQAYAASVGNLTTTVTAASALPYTVRGVSGGAGTGTGGTQGEYLLNASGGPLGLRIYGTVGSDGKATGVYRIDRGGISTSSSAPVLSWPSAAGFSVAPTAPTVTVGTIPAGTVFEAPTSDNSRLALWQNAAGTLAAVAGSDGTQFTRYVAAAIDAIVTPPAVAVPLIKAEIGSDLSDVTTATVGTLLASGNPTNNARVQLSEPVAHAGFSSRVEWSMSAGGTGAIYAVEPLPDGTYKVVYARSVTSAAGSNSADIADGPYLSTAARWGYERFTGGTVLYQTTAGVASPYLNAADVGAVGDIAAVAGTSPVTIGMRVTQIYAPAPLSAQIAAANAATATNAASIAAILAVAYPNSLTVGDAAAATLPTSLSYYWGTAPASSGGVLRQVRLQTVTGGLGTIVAARVVGSSITVLRSWTVTTTGGGTIDTFGTEVLGTYFVPANVAIFYVPVTSGGVRYGTGATAYRIPAGSSVADGSVVAFSTQAGATVSIDATIGYAASAAVVSRPADKSLIIERQTFAGSTASGAWSLTGWNWSSGLTATGTGWDQQAIFAQPSVMAAKTARAKVKLAAATDRVGVVYNCAALFPSTTGSYGGAGVIINGATGALEIYALDGAQTATLADSVALPSGFLVAGETYIIETKKAGLLMSAKVTRSLTRDAVSWSWNYNQTSDTRNLVRFFGAPGVVCLAGTPTITEFDYSAGVRPQPWVVALGDSIVENSSVGVGTTNWPTGWVYQLDAARGRGDVVIAARGGDTTAGVLSRLATDLTIWSPRFVLLPIGTNDGDQATWRTNMAAIIAAVQATGATPVLCTYIPRTGITGKQAQLTAMNADVMGQYFGPFDWVDFAAAVSVNHDRVTIDTSLYADTTTHPNGAGQAAMFAQLQADAPYLLD